MKKAISLIFVAVLLIGLAMPAFAATDTGIQPRYTYIQSVSTNISINQSTGTASCNGYISAKSSIPVKIHVQLQVKENGIWRTLCTRIANGTEETYVSFQYTVEKGYEYKVVTNAYAYNAQGTLVESTIYTDFASYPAS